MIQYSWAWGRLRVFCRSRSFNRPAVLNWIMLESSVFMKQVFDSTWTLLMIKLPYYQVILADKSSKVKKRLITPNINGMGGPMPRPKKVENTLMTTCKVKRWCLYLLICLFEIFTSSTLTFKLFLTSTFEPIFFLFSVLMYRRLNFLDF